jgi:hypothetical protein
VTIRSERRLIASYHGRRVDGDLDIVVEAILAALAAPAALVEVSVDPSDEYAVLVHATASKGEATS